MGLCSYNPSTEEGNSRGLAKVLGHPGIHSKNLSQKEKRMTTVSNTNRPSDYVLRVHY